MILYSWPLFYQATTSGDQVTAVAANTDVGEWATEALPVMSAPFFLGTSVLGDVGSDDFGVEAPQPLLQWPRHHFMPTDNYVEGNDAESEDGWQASATAPFGWPILILGEVGITTPGDEAEGLGEQVMELNQWLGTQRLAWWLPSDATDIFEPEEQRRKPMWVGVTTLAKRPRVWEI